MTRPNALQRLGRLLAIVPWIVAQDGPLVADVCRRFGVSEQELIGDLNLLFMCGVYPYTPDSLIEVDVDEGRVWVRFAEWFRRPLRLSPPEALALVAASRAALELGEPAEREGERTVLASALGKLELLVGAGAEETLGIALGQAPAEVLSTLQMSLRERRRAKLEYYSFGRDQSGERVVQPWHLFSSEGHWYLLAWCEKVQARRLFRVDRVRSAALVDGQFEVPANVGPVPVYEPAPADPLVVLELAAGARWVAERYPVEEVAQLDDGKLRVSLRASGDAWLERLLLRAGPDAKVISGANGVAQAAARRVLSVYSSDDGPAGGHTSNGLEAGARHLGRGHGR